MDMDKFRSVPKPKAGEFAGKSTADLIRLLGDVDPSNRRKAVNALAARSGELGEQRDAAVSELANLLSRPHEREENTPAQNTDGRNARRMAARTLGDLEGWSGLFTVIDAGEEEGAKLAWETIGRLGPPPEMAAAELVRLSGRFPDHATLWTALDKLGPRALPFFMQALNRQTAPSIAGRLKSCGPAACTALQAELDSPDPTRRELGALALIQEFPDHARMAAPLVEAQLDSSDFEARFEAAEALTRLEPAHRGAMEVFVEAIRGDRRQQKKAARHLAEMGPAAFPAIEPLVEYLEDSENRLLAQANRMPNLVLGLGGGELWTGQIGVIRVLKAIGPAAVSAVPLLNRVIDRALDDNDIHLTPVAVEALGAIDGPRQVERLISLLECEMNFAQRAAASTLGELGPVAGPARSALEKAERSDDWLVKNAAKTALEKVGRGAGPSSLWGWLSSLWGG